MTEAGYARILLDKKDTQIMGLESEITKLRIEYERQIKKLQKENTELKDDNKVMADNYFKKEQKFYNNLTNAKELLARWISDKPCTVSEHKDLISDTENFLKE